MDEFHVSIVLSVSLQCEEHINTADALLSTEDIRGAMSQIRDCDNLIQTLPESQEKMAMDIKLRSCRARILEYRNKHLAASYNYFEISLLPYDGDDEKALQEISKALEDGIKCVILAQHSAHKDTVLRKIMLDERVQLSSGFEMMECFQQNRIISKSKMDKYAKTLPMKDGMKYVGEWTVLQKSVYEHNMRSLAKLYKNINIEDAAVLLELTASETEDVARVMMSCDELKGSIDQIDGTLTFVDDTEGFHSFDSNIGSFLKDLELTTDKILERNIRIEKTSR